MNYQFFLIVMLVFFKRDADDIGLEDSKLTIDSKAIATADC